MNIELSEEQARVLMNACELAARCGMGQVAEASEWTIDRAGYDSLIKVEHELQMAGMTKGIASSEKYAKIAWDMYTSLRAVICPNAYYVKHYDPSIDHICKEVALMKVEK